ncbi:hypothetical protein PROFUN_15198 [Planoprotostelium fungivorum]|uniref:Protein kinase domain-containing protein n=1 Tax=Planoprotostelium fungivorum TaxID=1890364 RepID=A0A2P6MXN0_9EUKA|nr:hypothetical protein PROFUN_15198 [Planoprotostelium fungivorum]
MSSNLLSWTLLVHTCLCVTQDLKRAEYEIFVMEGEAMDAPEIAREKRYNGSEHIYSIGVLLWTMYTDNHHLYNAEINDKGIYFVIEAMMPGHKRQETEPE